VESKALETRRLNESKNFTVAIIEDDDFVQRRVTSSAHENSDETLWRFGSCNDYANRFLARVPAIIISPRYLPRVSARARARARAIA